MAMRIGTARVQKECGRILAKSGEQVSAVLCARFRWMTQAVNLGKVERPCALELKTGQRVDNLPFLVIEQGGVYCGRR